MSFPRYPKYKDSGVAWLEHIPSTWKLTSLKHGYSVTLGKMLQTDRKSDADQLLPYLRAANIQTKGVDTGDVRKMWMSPADVKNLRLQVGDLLVSEGGDVGRPAIWHYDKEMYIQNSVNRVRALTGNCTKFLFYWITALKAKGYIDVVCNKSTIAHFTAEKVASVPTPFPTGVEQVQIARFLDHETAKIDALIQEQERLIELLQEKRQAVISHAVTKGLDPDVAMKDSGVEWLGDVPEYWRVGALKRVLEVVADVDHYMPTSVASGVPYVMTGDLRRLVSEIDFDSCKQISREDFLKLTRKIRTSKGDVIMARYATIGTVSYVDIKAEFVVSYSCVTIRPRAGLATGTYLFFYFQSDAFIQGISNMINANTQGNVGVGDLKEVKIALPDIHEQKAIVEELEAELTKLDALVDQAKNSIGLMEERRSALISAAVTGKIDVRDWQPPEDGSVFDDDVRRAGMEVTA